jgi:hypothetical protein
VTAFPQNATGDLFTGNTPTAPTVLPKTSLTTDVAKPVNAAIPSLDASLRGQISIPFGFISFPLILK